MIQQTVQRHARLPASRAAPAPYEGFDRTLTIMVVEDDRAVAELLRRTINGRPGWGSIVVNNARGAREILRYVPVDLLVVDVNLPDLSGPRMLEQLDREFARRPPAILMSSAGLQPEVEQALDLGRAERFIAKPFDLDELIGALRATAQPADGPAEFRAGQSVAPRYQAAAYRWGAA